ncbi:SRPBCC domain-containing protein [Ruicaihuangia caeni]|uniref:SRPBCC domain-containing protein n=1 Tax=Ruicaihuangia caeni TaxID=3042517 RepID=UPI00338FA03C
MTPPVNGRIERDSQGRALVLEREYPLPAAELWRHCTQSELLEAWFGSFSARPAIGKTIALVMSEENSEVEHVTVLGCDPPRHFLGEFGRAGEMWRVGFDIATVASDDGTDAGTTGRERSRLTLRHYLRGHDELSGIGPGWEYYLDRLLSVLTHGEPPAWDEYFDTLSEPYRELQHG